MKSLIIAFALLALSNSIFASLEANVYQGLKAYYLHRILDQETIIGAQGFFIKSNCCYVVLTLNRYWKGAGNTAKNSKSGRTRQLFRRRQVCVKVCSCFTVFSLKFKVRFIIYCYCNWVIKRDNIANLRKTSNIAGLILVSTEASDIFPIPTNFNPAGSCPNCKYGLAGADKINWNPDVKVRTIIKI